MGVKPFLGQAEVGSEERTKVRSEAGQTKTRDSKKCNTLSKTRSRLYETFTLTSKFTR